MNVQYINNSNDTKLCANNQSSSTPPKSRRGRKRNEEVLALQANDPMYPLTHKFKLSKKSCNRKSPLLETSTLDLSQCEFNWNLSAINNENINNNTATTTTTMIASSSQPKPKRVCNRKDFLSLISEASSEYTNETVQFGNVSLKNIPFGTSETIQSTTTSSLTHTETLASSLRSRFLQIAPPFSPSIYDRSNSPSPTSFSPFHSPLAGHIFLPEIEK